MVLSLEFVTYTLFVAGSTAIPAGLLPTFRVATTEFVVASMTLMVFEVTFAAKTYSEFAATPPGSLSTGILAMTAFEEMSITSTAPGPFMTRLET